MRAARQQLGLSQSELAKLVGVSRQTINMIENGGYNPTILLCLRICHALQVTLNDIFWR
ncbi:MAG: helix-turn-helix transcriptional regulator [Clostridia bacterium]|nr:helix-turn-helix transcriptional regulator [Clostridia bacterium]MBQ3056474.1 helix-turn-helix transcriptional regulator [Clostridia bacterium]